MKGRWKGLVSCLLLLGIMVVSVLIRSLSKEQDNIGLPVISIPTPSTQVESNKHFDVLINGYMRSGSTFTGMILGHRDDTFYFYEPLLKMSLMTYWHGNRTMCRADRFECWSSNATVDVAKQFLHNIYDCEIDYLNETVITPKFSIGLGGPSWNQVARCANKVKNSSIVCIQRHLPVVCKNSKHRVTKVLRLTTDILGDMLKTRANMKVIHLFRDPRAIISSRNRTAWFPVHTDEELIENAKSLCNKMSYDINKGKELLKLYPDRFRFIFFEDLYENVYEKTKQLFRFLGMDLDETKYVKVKKILASINSAKQSNTVFRWRQLLKWDMVQTMEPVCAEVYKELGYKSIQSFEEYKNLTIKSFDIPKEYLLI